MPGDVCQPLTPLHPAALHSKSGIGPGREQMATLRLMFEGPPCCFFTVAVSFYAPIGKQPSKRSGPLHPHPHLLFSDFFFFFDKRHSRWHSLRISDVECLSTHLLAVRIYSDQSQQPELSATRQEFCDDIQSAGFSKNRGTFPFILRTPARFPSSPSTLGAKLRL